jgi:hypothetical protein
LVCAYAEAPDPQMANDASTRTPQRCDRRAEEVRLDLGCRLGNKRGRLLAGAALKFPGLSHPELWPSSRPPTAWARFREERDWRITRQPNSGILSRTRRPKRVQIRIAARAGGCR